MHFLPVMCVNHVQSNWWYWTYNKNFIIHYDCSHYCICLCINLSVVVSSWCVFYHGIFINIVYNVKCLVIVVSSTLETDTTVSVYWQWQWHCQSTVNDQCIVSNNNNNNNTRTMFMVLSSCCSSIARVHPGSRGECSTAPGGRRPLDQSNRLEP